ncbi:MAG: hypothetical protein K6L73_04495 [Cellvibrionaceae bacterium]
MKKTFHKQQGFLIPVAMFIIVVMAIFAAALSRTTSETSLGAIQEVISTQAFYAAESGAQWGMGGLFMPLVARTGAGGTDSRCTGMNETITFTASGLSNCSATVTCSVSFGAVSSAYVINSVGACGPVGANYRAVRTVEVSSFLED